MDAVRKRGGEREEGADRETERVRTELEFWLGFWPFLKRGGAPEPKFVIHFRASKFPRSSSSKSMAPREYFCLRGAV